MHFQKGIGYTANVFPIKSVGNPRVTGGTPHYACNYHGVYLLPANPAVSHFIYTCKNCITNCMQALHVISLEFTGKSLQNLQGNHCKLYHQKYLQWPRFFLFVLRSFIIHT